MNFYLVKIVFISEVQGFNTKKQYEEKLLCLKAMDKKDAYLKTVEYAQKEEIDFINAHHHNIQWKFEGVTYISKINDINHLIELYSEVKEEYSDIDTLIIKQQASRINSQIFQKQE